MIAKGSVSVCLVVLSVVGAWAARPSDEESIMAVDSVLAADTVSAKCNPEAETELATRTNDEIKGMVETLNNLAEEAQCEESAALRVAILAATKQLQKDVAVAFQAAKAGLNRNLAKANAKLVLHDALREVPPHIAQLEPAVAVCEALDMTEDADVKEGRKILSQRKEQLSEARSKLKDAIASPSIEALTAALALAEEARLRKDNEDVLAAAAALRTEKAIIRNGDVLWLKLQLEGENNNIYVQEPVSYEGVMYKDARMGSVAARHTPLKFTRLDGNGNLVVNREPLVHDATVAIQNTASKGKAMYLFAQLLGWAGYQEKDPAFFDRIGGRVQWKIIRKQGQGTLSVGDEIELQEGYAQDFLVGNIDRTDGETGYYLEVTNGEKRAGNPHASYTWVVERAPPGDDNQAAAGEISEFS